MGETQIGMYFICYKDQFQSSSTTRKYIWDRVVLLPQ